jgi:hypothetical protein
MRVLVLAGAMMRSEGLLEAGAMESGWGVGEWVGDVAMEERDSSGRAFLRDRPSALVLLEPPSDLRQSPEHPNLVLRHWSTLKYTNYLLLQ